VAEAWGVPVATAVAPVAPVGLVATKAAVGLGVEAVGLGADTLGGVEKCELLGL